MEKVSIVIDTDIGSDIDDAYALVFALNSPEINIKSIITNNSNVEKKAKIARKFAKNIPIFKGIENDKGVLTTSIGEKSFSPDYFWNHLELFREPNLVYVSLGGLSNLAYFLDKGFKFKEIIIMGGSIEKDYKGRNRKIAEWNLNCDLASTKKVLNSESKIILVTLDSTWNLELNKDKLKEIELNDSPTSYLLNKHLEEMQEFLHKKFGIKEKKPVLHDPLAIYASFGKDFLSSKKLILKIENDGLLSIDKKGKKIETIIKCDNKFLDFFMERIIK
jgi:inosine-uridine nucleoside N-ribohydrolase